MLLKKTVNFLLASLSLSAKSKPTEVAWIVECLMNPECLHTVSDLNTSNCKCYFAEKLK